MSVRCLSGGEADCSSYNSSVFKEIAASKYDVFVVTPSFFTVTPVFNSNDTDTDTQAEINYLRNNNPLGLERLDNAACIKAYSSKILSDRGGVFVVSKNSHSGQSVVLDSRQPDPISRYIYPLGTVITPSAIL